jgi:carbamate kinase
MAQKDQKIALVAFGGNALLRANEKGLESEQNRHAEEAAEMMVDIVTRGYELAVVHGNGPQVGNALIRVEESITKIPPVSLDVCVSETQGSMGYLLERALRNALRKRRVKKEVITLISQVLVDARDPAFKNPTKPIGPFYTIYRAHELEKKKGWTLKQDAGRGYRKVVASPRPREIVNMPVIKKLIAEKNILIAAGGGGIPVFRTSKGLLRGIEAVIDKDYSASLLARALGVDIYINLTGVDSIYLNFGKKNQEPAPVLTVREAKAYYDAGEFPAGSMGPKILAAIEFVAHSGKEVLITSTEAVKKALQGDSGTRIVP